MNEEVQNIAEQRKPFYLLDNRPKNRSALSDG